MKEYKRAVLFVNGDATPGFSVSIKPSDWLVAVDGGLRHIFAQNRMPDVLIGDLDSVNPQQLAACEVAQVEILRFTPVKDKTDLELALDLTVERNFKHIVIAYAQGSRHDHSLANMALLARPDLEGLDVKLEDGMTSVNLIKGPAKQVIASLPGNLVSLIPWGVPAQGVTTQNLQYPLVAETLLPWQARGVSNVSLANYFTIHLDQGALFIMQTKPSNG